MSGALARALGTVSAVGSAFTLLTGGGPVTLDDVTFESFEVPETVRWGGGHALTLHRFPGGARVIDAMGPDDADICWSGIFGITGNPSGRAQALDELRREGIPVSLVWGDFSRTVVVRDAEFESLFGRINYRIACCVLPDDSDGVGGVAPSLIEQISDDINGTLGFDLTGTLAGAVQGIQQVAQTAGSVVGLVSPSAGAALTTGLNSVLTVVGTAQAATDAALGAAADGVNIVGGIGQLGAALSAANDAATGSVVAGYLNRALANVAAG